jgi:hypothetical protein
MDIKLEELWKKAKDAFDEGGYDALELFEIESRYYNINLDTAISLDTKYFGTSNSTKQWKYSYKQKEGGLLTW